MVRMLIIKQIMFALFEVLLLLEHTLGLGVDIGPTQRESMVFSVGLAKNHLWILKVKFRSPRKMRQRSTCHYCS